MAADRTPDAELAALVADCWPRAQAHWSRFLLLQRPAEDLLDLLLHPGVGLVQGAGCAGV